MTTEEYILHSKLARHFREIDSIDRKDYHSNKLKQEDRKIPWSSGRNDMRYSRKTN